MASETQTNLSTFIKSIHKKLREEAKVLGTEQAWKNHCEDEEKLEKYAEAMKDLAVNHWDKNSEKDAKVVSRVSWVYEACKEYFSNIDKYRDKERRIAKDCLNLTEKGSLGSVLNSSGGCTDAKYQLLDVGSCYNPFKQFEIFDVLPIDIAPAKSEVFKCDFLNLKVSDTLLAKERSVQQLPKSYFDVIVFSLLLEYLPSPELRLKCCLNAYKLLKNEGILVIITPDSNHVGSNAKIIKSWRFVLAKHGFVRVKYEKLTYLHCMVFRKALFKEVAERWAEIHESEGFLRKIFIPQDFQEIGRSGSEVEPVKSPDGKEKWSNETFLDILSFNNDVE